MRKYKPSICIVAHNAYGNISGKETGHIGGVEVQIPLMARWLVAKGYKTSVITWDHGQVDGEMIQGITVYKLGRKDHGLPVVKFFTKWAELRSALARADADIYYYNIGDVALGQIVHWARRRGKRVLYSVCNEVDCVPELPLLPEFRERFFYKYGLRHADSIAVQTFRQQNLLREHFDLKSRQVPYPSEGFEAAISGEGGAHADPHKVLWIGRFSAQKRLEWLLDLAELLPTYVFDVIGWSNSEDPETIRLVERAKTMSNVNLLGRIPHHMMGFFFQNARILCCTSSHEGFPNIFLEAWSVGLPTITTFDPDGLVAANQLGAAVVTVEDLAEAITESTQSGRWEILSANAYRFFRENHQVENSMKIFEQIFLELVDQGQRSDGKDT